MVTNYEHLITLEPFEIGSVIVNLLRESCVYCPRLREHRCNEDCGHGVEDWLLMPYIKSSSVWKIRKMRCKNEREK